MKTITPYRDPTAIRKVVKEIELISTDGEINLMEVCGTHTMAIKRFGIDALLPENIKLLSGPGCPVCVTPTSFIDTAIKLTEKKDIIVATFGDMMRVPGTDSSLETAKAKGGKVEIIYSPVETLNLAEKHKEKKVVLLAIGFETTAPSIGITLLDAKKKKLKNFFILEGNRLIPPAIRAILDDPESKIDGFILPGHVCTIIGYEIFEFIPATYGIPCVVSGFEPLDILIAIKELLKMIATNKPKVANAYPRAVKYDGNRKAREVISTVFQVADVTWRGLGTVEKSGLMVKEEFKYFNILNHIKVDSITTQENPACLCGDILKGKAFPYECPLFGKGCTPASPKGPCMISSEGSCAAYYKYDHH